MKGFSNDAKVVEAKYKELFPEETEVNSHGVNLAVEYHNDFVGLKKQVEYLRPTLAGLDAEEKKKRQVKQPSSRNDKALCELARAIAASDSHWSPI